MNLTLKIVLFIGFSGILSCQNNPTFENFDSVLWKKDPKGCLDTRKKQILALRKDRNVFLKCTQHQIIDILGLPNASALAERDSRFYFYFLEPSQQCSKKEKQNNEISVLVFRFNTLGRVTEVLFEKGIPK